MANSAAFRNTGTAAQAAAYRWVSLHTADPGANGANEVAGSVRAQTTFAAPVNGVAAGSGADIAVPAGGPYTHYGLWTAQNAGTFGTGGPLPAPVTYETDGVYTATPTLNGV